MKTYQVTQGQMKEISAAIATLAALAMDKRLPTEFRLAAERFSESAEVAIGEILHAGPVEVMPVSCIKPQ